ncbi:unnamed protein product [Acanthoscelides obtectus]|uniref:Methylosome subunit pICln n=1 Tax=Acanthoscelides obtectus TaxID=200917 RepID=A0A9P0KXA6_ACAOB|nr:unnamed protein product [Acanthoscelides obtectus]CAK1671929.1 Methylosome subunit pICln [Acanthoscelides obtectus]
MLINSFKHPDSNIRLQQRDVCAVLDKKDLGNGTLYVSESTLCWQKDDESIGFTIGYHKISLHAISRDTQLCDKECIYVVLDGKMYMPGDEPKEDPDDEDASDADSSSEVTELLLIPENMMLVQTIYETIKVCQELNPDPNDIDDEEDHIYQDAEDEMEEAEYVVHERGGGDADIDDLSHRIQNSSVSVNYNYSNGDNDEEEFQDAD